MSGRYNRKVVFIYPGIAYIGYNSFNRSLKNSDSDPIYAFSILASIIAEKGYEVELIDLRQIRDEGELRERLLQSDAGIAAISVQTPSYDFACSVAKIAKAAGKVTIAGGIHVTVSPEDFETRPEWDYYIMGEGEVSFLKLLDELMSGQKPAKAIQGNILFNLDELPLPHFFSEWEDKYKETYSVEVARGCPGRCSYCVSGEKRFYKKIRFRSVGHIMKEIDYVYDKFGFKHLLFLDVCASTNRKFFREVLTELLKKYSHLNITTQERVDSFNEEVAQLLSQFKSCMVWFGFESASPRILKFINKNTSVEEGKRAADICRKYNLDIGANVLIGIPTETDDDISRTYDFIKSINPKMLFCNILSPFPGTQVYRYCMEKGIFPELDSYERYELRYVLEKGFIRGIDYNKVRQWHRKFNRMIDDRSKSFLRRKFSWLLGYRIVSFLYRKFVGG